MNGEVSDEENREKEQNGVVNGEKGEKDGEKEKSEDKEEEKEEKEEDKDQEVVLIQDTGFNVKIIVPGIEDFELPVSKTLLYVLMYGTQI